MTEEELEAIEAREEAATPRPWETLIRNENWKITYYVSMPNDILKVSSYILEDHEREDGNYRFVNDNAEFIAHARQDVPALIAEVKHQNAEIERLTRERDAAVADLRRSSKAHEDCHACAHVGGNTARCDFGEDCWEWRGAQA